MIFRERLAPAERHFVHRLESFADIVFGFSIAQLALQLNVPKTPADVFADPSRWVLFFGTFAIIGYAWVSFHGMMTGAFAPRWVDVILVFVYLAFTALFPYAMYVNIAFGRSAEYAKVGFAIYIAVWLGVSLMTTAIDLRALRRGWKVVDDPTRARLWRRGRTSVIMILTMAAALVVDLWPGPPDPWRPLYGSIPLFFIGPLAGFARRVFPRPPAWLLGAEEAVDGTAPAPAGS